MNAALASSSGRLTSRSREWLQPMALVAVGLVAAFFLASGLLALYKARSPWEAQARDPGRDIVRP